MKTTSQIRPGSLAFVWLTWLCRKAIVHTVRFAWGANLYRVFNCSLPDCCKKNFSAPCVVPHISHGFVADRASGSSVPHTHTIDVGCLSQFQKTHNSTPVCKNGTWSRIPKCIPGTDCLSYVYSSVLTKSRPNENACIYASDFENENCRIILVRTAQFTFTVAF